MVCAVRCESNSSHRENNENRKANRLEIKINGVGFILRRAVRWRLAARDFIEIIAVSSALDQIPLINHQFNVIVKCGAANTRVLLCVLLRQIEIISILV